MAKPYGSEEWSEDEWRVFNTRHPDFEKGDRMYAFDGDDMCNDGLGDCWWDGESRRCSCGNRRVYWWFEGEWVYPETW